MDSLARTTSLEKLRAERLGRDLAPQPYQSGFIRLYRLSDARYAPIELKLPDGPPYLSECFGRYDGTCNLCYRICIIIYGKSYIANCGGDLSPRRAKRAQDRLPGHVRCSGQNENPHFPPYGKSHMQYQSCNIAYAHSETPRRPFKIVDPVSRIISEISAMPHQLSFMANGTCGISYP